MFREVSVADGPDVREMAERMTREALTLLDECHDVIAMSDDDDYWVSVLRASVERTLAMKRMLAGVPAEMIEFLTALGMGPGSGATLIILEPANKPRVAPNGWDVAAPEDDDQELVLVALYKDGQLVDGSRVWSPRSAGALISSWKKEHHFTCTVERRLRNRARELVQERLAALAHPRS